MSMSRRTLSALVVALFATASLSAASVQGSFQRTFQVSGPVDLEVLTRSGRLISRCSRVRGTLLSAAVRQELCR